MPYPGVPDEMTANMDRCVEHVMGQGHDKSSAVAICHASIVKGDAGSIQQLSDMGFKLSPSDVEAIKAHWAAKFSEIVVWGAVKAVGDWELDVLAVPFGGKDSDGQWFDDGTDIMPHAFSTPLAVYQHGVKQGAQGVSDHPIIVGKTVAGSLEKLSDGWHIRVILDKTIKVAKAIMDAAYKGMVAVSSGSISHLARLEINGKSIMYDKRRAGRISVWPLAEVSLWERGGGNMQPANRFAVALPAMKAIYRDAGLPFPDVDDTHGADVNVSDEAARRAKVKRIKSQSDQLIKKADKLLGSK